MTERINRLLDHLRWADERTLASVRATPTTEAERLAAHLVATESLYLARMRGEDPWPQDFWPTLSIAECEAIAATTHAELRTFVGGLGVSESGRRAAYRTSRGESQESSIADMLLHLAIHGEHHRGQIARVVREAGGEPAMTDFIVWTREQPPATPGRGPEDPTDVWPGGMPTVGQVARRSRTVRAEDIERFTAISGDRNPIHYDEAIASATRFGGIVVQGGVTTAILNAVVAEDLPGPGTVFLQTSWRFLAPVRPGDAITGEVRVTAVRDDKPITELETRVVLDDGTIVLDGTAVCYTMPLRR